MKNKKLAFTLSETMITLLVTSIIVSLIFYFSQIDFTKYPTNAFFNSFHKEWIQNQSLSKQNKFSTQVIINRNDRKVYFINRLKKTSLIIPKGLNTYSSIALKINANGYTKPGTIYWYSNANKTYKQTFQMGWGIYHIKEQNGVYNH
ncbi:hypothetical protein M2S00_04290 [Apilactobacillus sp. TMW 2.2459]|uniref:hypothetical protein n=1 Tax=Apilactobacillus xinyiensis TaxID=2841032 RepID=UPI001C7D16AC|nr:hypothetical protein [Apilactobacillus xinyiensis]MCL0312321.1 hypothetical protein [Apilactobacillus xinyiensis]